MLFKTISNLSSFNGKSVYFTFSAAKSRLRLCGQAKKTKTHLSHVTEIKTHLKIKTQLAN